MAKVRMKRIEIIALLTDGKSVVERLQRRGAVDLLQRETSDKEDGLENISTLKSIQLFERNETVVSQALEILDEKSPIKTSLFSSIEPRKSITTAQFKEMADKAEENIRIANKIISLNQKISECNVNIKSRKQYADALESWRKLAVPLRFKGTADTTAFIGTLPGQWDSDTLVESFKLSPDKQVPIEVQVVYSYREQSGVFILCHKDFEQECTKALRKLGYALPPYITDKPPAVVIEDYRNEANLLNTEIQQITEKIKSYKDERQQLIFTLDYLSMRADKYRALESITISQKTMIIEGYIKEEKADALVAELENKYTISVKVSEPTEDEEPPVAFKNKLPAAALEDITEAYSMPSKMDVDPNGVMSLFYYLFFGLMLSDAGYGLVMVIFTSLILYFKKPEGNVKRNMQKFMICGFSTIIWGAMFNSWFGDIITVVAKNFFGKDITLWSLLNPVEDPMALLALSLILGFIQIIVGLIVKFYSMWRSGQRLDAIFDVGMWWVVFAGIVIMLIPMVNKTTLPLQSIGTGVAVAGAIGLILTQGRSAKNIVGKILGGIGSLYNITGYFSDILSYSRLMALGLVTGIIASVVNSIGSMLGGGVAGAIMLTIVFIFGHSINFAINALGAYVHCNRLQYVEFFSKFYEGGGRLFKPLQVNTKHYKFKEEI